MTDPSPLVTPAGLRAFIATERSLSAFPAMLDKALLALDAALRERDEHIRHERHPCCCLLCVKAREAAEARVVKLEEALTDVRVNGRFGDHSHWDSSGRSGVGCPVCIDQRAVAERVRAALRTDAQEETNG